MQAREYFTVSLFDGSPNGLVEYKNGNWTGIAYKLSRKEKDKYKNSPDIKLNYPGVYILLGKFDGKPTVYIGKAQEQSIMDRLYQHDMDGAKEALTTVIAFTKINSMGPNQIGYLENKFYEMAKASKTYKVQNNKIPGTGNITPQEECEFTKFIDYVKLVMKVIGCDVFEKAEKIIDYFILHSKDKKAFGRGTGVKKEFVVLEGSYINKAMDRLTSDNNFRSNYASVIDADGKLTEDTVFSSQSKAANFVLGYGISGILAWKPVKQSVY